MKNYSHKSRSAVTALAFLLVMISVQFVVYPEWSAQGSPSLSAYCNGQDFLTIDLGDECELFSEDKDSEYVIATSNAKGTYDAKQSEDDANQCCQMV
jgi:hypothetical protein